MFQRLLWRSRWQMIHDEPATQSRRQLCPTGPPSHLFGSPTLQVLVGFPGNDSCSTLRVRRMFLVAATNYLRFTAGISWRETHVTFNDLSFGDRPCFAMFLRNSSWPRDLLGKIVDTKSSCFDNDCGWCHNNVTLAFYTVLHLLQMTHIIRVA